MDWIGEIGARYTAGVVKRIATSDRANFDFIHVSCINPTKTYQRNRLKIDTHKTNNGKYPRSRVPDRKRHPTAISQVPLKIALVAAVFVCHTRGLTWPDVVMAP